MLLRCLDYLSQQLFKASMVRDDDEVMAKQVLPPLLRGDGDGT